MGFLRQTANSKPTDRTSAWVGALCARLSRFLLLLAAVEVFTMPLTQHLWTWDHFLQGGQDFELGLLVIVTCLCLVLLRAQHSRQGLKVLLAIRRLFLFIFVRQALVRLMREVQLSVSPPKSECCPASALYTLPLQI